MIVNNDELYLKQSLLFRSYVNELDISNNIKSLLTNKKFMDSNPFFYLYYPKLFSSTFEISDKIENLCIAGYLYFQSTLFLDELIDDNKKEKIIFVLISQEESIKLLTHIFGIKSKFWEFWLKRKDEYFNAVNIEKQIKNKKNIYFNEYEKLAGYKSAFGKSAIDAVYTLSKSKNETIYNALLKSHDYFSVAFQLNDDMQDFKKDFESKQFNWAYYLMKKANDINEDIVTLNKLFYIKGYAKKVLLKAIIYIEKAKKEIKDIDVPLWLNLLNKTKEQFVNSIIEIDNYLEIINSEVELSNNLIKNNTVKISIEKAKKFIFSNQKINGSWKEYINQGGISDIWSTAYIVSKISEIKLSKLEFKKIQNAITFLIKSEQEKFWGYNSTWITDLDTTNFVFLSFLGNNIPISEKSYNKWLEHQKKDGSFSTYLDESYLINSLSDKNISDVKGWISTHYCVSSTSFFFLSKEKQKTTEFKKINNFFANLDINNIFSYWWTSNIYTYYYLAKSYNILGEKTKIKTIIKILKTFQNKDGSFSDKYGVNQFYTGLALETFLLDQKNYIKEIEITKNYLLNQQFEDGSWKNSYSLQVPNSSDIIPSKLDYPISKNGMNVRAKEFNRLFTTSTILKALDFYEETIINS